MSLTNEPSLYEDKSGKGPSSGGTNEQRMRVSVKNKIKLKGTNSDTVSAVRTLVTAGTTKKIELVEGADSHIIYHLEAGEFIYIGDSLEITAAINSAALESGHRFEFLLKKGNENNLFADASSGTITVYAIGVYRE